MTKSDELLSLIAKAQGIARSMGNRDVCVHLDLAKTYATPLRDLHKTKGLPMTPKLKKAAFAAILTVPILFTLFWPLAVDYYNFMLRCAVIVETW